MCVEDEGRKKVMETKWNDSWIEREWKSEWMNGVCRLQLDLLFFVACFFSLSLSFTACLSHPIPLLLSMLFGFWISIFLRSSCCSTSSSISLSSIDWPDDDGDEWRECTCLSRKGDNRFPFIPIMKRKKSYLFSFFTSFLLTSIFPLLPLSFISLLESALSSYLLLLHHYHHLGSRTGKVSMRYTRLKKKKGTRQGDKEVFKNNKATCVTWRVWNRLEKERKGNVK